MLFSGIKKLYIHLVITGMQCYNTMMDTISITSEFQIWTNKLWAKLS